MEVIHLKIKTKGSPATAMVLRHRQRLEEILPELDSNEFEIIHEETIMNVDAINLDEASKAFEESMNKVLEDAANKVKKEQRRNKTKRAMVFCGKVAVGGTLLAGAAYLGHRFGDAVTAMFD